MPANFPAAASPDPFAQVKLPLLTVTGQLAEPKFYVWGNGDCDFAADAWPEALQVWLEFKAAGVSDPYIVDCHGEQVVDAAIFAREAQAAVDAIDAAAEKLNALLENSGNLESEAIQSAVYALRLAVAIAQGDEGRIRAAEETWLALPEPMRKLAVVSVFPRRLPGDGEVSGAPERPPAVVVAAAPASVGQAQSYVLKNAEGVDAAPPFYVVDWRSEGSISPPFMSWADAKSYRAKALAEADSSTLLLVEKHKAASANTKRHAAGGVDIQALLAASEASQLARETLAQHLAAIPDDRFAISARTSDGRTAAVTPSAQKPGQYQLTRFDRAGEPWGDSQYTSKVQAVDDMLHEVDADTLVVGAGEVEQISHHANGNPIGIFDSRGSYTADVEIAQADFIHHAVQFEATMDRLLSILDAAGALEAVAIQRAAYVLRHEVLLAYGDQGRIDAAEAALAELDAETEDDTAAGEAVAERA